MKKAFTLIELLVVIAIISLLMSIIVPAVRRVKQQATGAVCLTNVRGLSACWQAYLADNNGYLVSSHVPLGDSNRDDDVTYWIETPQDDDGNYMSGEDEVTLEYEQNGIREGALFPYVEALDAYHCPGDKSDKMGYDNDSGTKPWFNSYSLSGLMNGRVTYSDEAADKMITRETQIVSPGNKVTFIENTDPRGWLMGAWEMYFLDDDPPGWNDLIAIWHRDRSSLGFADGHAEMHQWVDETTLENAENGEVLNDRLSESDPGDDIDYMRRAYVPGRR